MIRILISLFVLSTAYSYAQETKKVLFIGNSYTHYNSMPEMVSQMAASTGDVLIYGTHTPGGARLKHHASNPTVYTKMSNKTWDFVALQAQSQEPSWGEWQVAEEVYPYAKQLCDSIKSKNPGSVPLFYMTWGRENGDARNCAFLDWVCTYEGMDSMLYKRYMYMAEINKSNVSPVGHIWRYLRDNNYSVDLYNADGSHPSVSGSYIGALSFYILIFKKNPTRIKYNSTLTPAVADTLKNIVKMLVYDNLQKWVFGESITVDSHSISNKSLVSVQSKSVDGLFHVKTSEPIDYKIFDITGRQIEVGRIAENNTLDLRNETYMTIFNTHENENWVRCGRHHFY